MEIPNQDPSQMPLTDREVIGMFAHCIFPAGYIGVCIAYPPERTKDGIILGQDRRENMALEDLLKNGGLIVGAGKKAEENNITVGCRGYISAHGRPMYIFTEEDLVMYIYEQHFICMVTPPTDLDVASLFISADEEDD